MAISLNLFPGGAVGFIDWLDGVAPESLGVALCSIRLERNQKANPEREKRQHNAAGNGY